MTGVDQMSWLSISYHSVTGVTDKHLLSIVMVVFLFFLCINNSMLQFQAYPI